MDKNAGSIVRDLPRIDAILEHPDITALSSEMSREHLLRIARAEVDSEREAILAGKRTSCPTVDEFAARVACVVREKLAPKHYPTINMTGIILNTSLGRAPLAPSVARHIYEGISGYCRLAAHPRTGKRYDRDILVGKMIAEIFGAEAATFVNNNAAATYLVLTALTAGKEVIVSRGQLVEIGGKFRSPAVMAASGAKLVEVGTTNRTHLKDYKAAITENTGAILRVHTSNFRIKGFASTPTIAELAELAHEHGLLCIDDVGSGQPMPFAPLSLPDDYDIHSSVAAGADIICFSGDKLLGGVQSGIILGKKEHIERMRSHPLVRALRCDKMTVLGLDATMRLYYNPEKAMREIPVLRHLGIPSSELKKTAMRLSRRIGPEYSKRVVEDRTYVGGGSLPDIDLRTWTIRLQRNDMGAEELASRLRLGTPAVFPRVEENEVILDLRTLLPGQEKGLLSALKNVGK
ncbi:MAG: L-seryl-tRNA(Sec) selenium transferase [Planctomycetota bacterium]